MTSLVLAFGHSAVPMGQQLHERWLLEALLATAPAPWSLRPTTVRAWRAPAGELQFGSSVRVPTRLVGRLPSALQAVVGSAVYGKADLYHRFDLRLPPTPGPELVTVHDLPGVRFPDEGPVPAAVLSSAQRARGVICPSEFAAAEVRELLGIRRTWVIPNGVSPFIARAVPFTTDDLRSRGIDRSFVLHAAGSTTRKNLPALAAAWRALPSDIRDQHLLVQCGPPSPARSAAFAGVPGVVHLGHLHPQEVARLMRSASAVIVPSVYEGFGLPALEGMAAGAPVVAANRAALPEVCSDGALLVEPDAEGLAEGLAAVLRDGELARALASKGRKRAQDFTWAEAARRHMRTYEEVLQR